MKTLNVRLVAILLGCGLVCCVAVYFVHGFQLRRNAYVYLERAEEAKQRAEKLQDEDDAEKQMKEYVEAIQNLDWYIKLVPDDVEALTDLGWLWADIAQIARDRRMFSNAFSMLEKVLRHDSTRTDVRRKLIEIYIALERYADARDHIESLPDEFRNDGEMLEFLGRCQAATGEDSSAVESFQSAIESSPHRVGAYAGLAWVLLRREGLNRPAEADQWMMKLLESNPQSPRTHLMYSRYLVDLASINSLADARQRPILLDMMVPVVLDEAVKHTVGLLELADDSPDALEVAEKDATKKDVTKKDVLKMTAKRKTLVDVLRHALGTYDGNLKFDDPETLLLTTREPVLADELDVTALEKARDLALDAVKAELQPDEDEALQVAVDNGVLVDAMKISLQAFSNRAMLFQGAIHGLLLEAGKHALQARELASADRAALKKVLDDGILVAAMEEVLDGNVDRLTLRLTANRDKLSAAVTSAGGNDDVLLQAAQRGILVDAMVAALKDHALVSGDADAVSQAVKDSVENSDALLENVDREALMLAAQCSLQKREYDKVREYGEDGIESYPEYVPMYSLLADLENRVKQADAAIAWLRQGLEATDGNVQLRWKLAGLLLDMGNVKEAQKIIDKWGDAKYSRDDRRKVPPAQVAKAYLQARIALLNGEWLAASSNLEKVRSGLAIWPRLLTEVDTMLAKCYQRLGNIDRQEVVLKRILEATPFNSAARLGLTNLYLSRGKPDEALKMYQPVFRQGRASASHWLAFAKILMAKKLRQPDPDLRNWQDVEQALDQATKMAQAVLDEAPKTTAEVTPDAAPAATFRESEASRVLVEVPILRSQVLMAQDRVQEAEQLLQDASQGNPKAVQFWLALIGRAQQKDDWDQVTKLLNQAEQMLGDTVALRLARARYLVRRFGKDAIGGLKELAQNIDAFSENEKLVLWQGLLNSALQAGDVAWARQFGQQIADTQPNNVQVRLLLFELALSANDVEDMKKKAADIRKVEGEGSHWLYAQAVVLSSEAEGPKDKRLSEAMQLVARARKLNPSWSRLPLLTAEIYNRQGNPETAVTYYEQAFAMGERSPAAIARCVRLYAHLGLSAEANKKLDMLGAQQNVITDAEISRIRLSSGGDLTGALEFARKAAAGSTHYQDHVLLARILSIMARRAKQNGQATEARNISSEVEGALRRAVSLADNMIAPRVALIQFLVEAQRKPEAQKVVEEVRRRASAKDGPLIMASCYEALQELGQAQKSYEAALAAAPTDAKIVRAVAEFYLRAKKTQPASAQLEKIVGGKIKTEGETLKWARRQLALILAPGNYRDWERAKRLIDENLASGSNTDDQRIKADILAMARLKGSRDELQKLLEDLKNKSPDDQFRLVQIYHSQGEWAKAKPAMRQLLTAHGDNPKYVMTYVTWLVRRGDLQAADPWLRKLEQIAPNHFGTVNLRADVLFRQKRFAEAIKMVKDFVGRSGAQPASEEAQLRLVATALEEYAGRMTQPDQKATAERLLLDVETIYRRLVRMRPGYELLWAAFSARQGHIDEALTSAEKALPNVGAQWAAQLCSVLLSSPAANDEQIKRSEKLLQDALQKYNRESTLLMVLATAHSHQGRYDEAEATYRKILAKDDKHAVAMNNLAVLLALRKIKLDESLRLIERAIEITGPIAPMLDSRATVHMALGRSDKALDDMKMALQENTTAVRQFHQALAFHNSGQQPAAVEALKKANDLGLKPEMLDRLELPVYREMQNLLR